MQFLSINAENSISASLSIVEPFTLSDRIHADPHAEKPRWVPIYTARNPNGRRGHSVVVKSHAPNEFFLFGGQRGKCVFCIMLWGLFHESHSAASSS
jgi:hypothetical protein